MDDAVPNVIWTRNVLNHKGTQIYYAGNQSAVLLGRTFSGKRTIYISTRDTSL